MQKFNIVILISGYGSNLKAIIDYVNNFNLPINISAVISSNNQAYGLTIAQQHNIATYILDSQRDSRHGSQDNLSSALLNIIHPYNPKLIILAGFMKILPEQFINYYPNKILNIHPSLLPKYPGLNTHQQVIDNNEPEHGCTIHYVTKDLDAGPIIAQQKIAVCHDDTKETLKLKVQKLEHELYPKVIASLIIKVNNCSSNREKYELY
ncbi:MAG: phosphoribosylglycinamide formyltransferase [Gammaproteobacteria bacterium]|nr:phosphoribosylglycinamide formyltransferase [Gammaproteobacteria bacterium]